MAKTWVSDTELREYHESTTRGRGFPSYRFERRGDNVIATSFRYYVGGISAWFEAAVTFDFGRISRAEALTLYYLPAIREDYFEQVVSEYDGQSFNGFGSSGEQVAAYHAFDTAITEIFTWIGTSDRNVRLGNNTRRDVAKALIKYFKGK